MEAWEIARALGIDYVYLDAVERTSVAGPALEKFENNSQYFVPVFRNAEVLVFSVVKPAGSWGILSQSTRNH
jgi:hypothetical protein